MNKTSQEIPVTFHYDVEKGWNFRIHSTLTSTDYLSRRFDTIEKAVAQFVKCAKRKI